VGVSVEEAIEGGGLAGPIGGGEVLDKFAGGGFALDADKSGGFEKAVITGIELATKGLDVDAVGAGIEPESDGGWKEERLFLTGVEKDGEGCRGMRVHGKVPRYHSYVILP